MRLINLTNEEYKLHQDTEDGIIRNLTSADSDLDDALYGIQESETLLTMDRESIAGLLDEIKYKLGRLEEALKITPDNDPNQWAFE